MNSELLLAASHIKNARISRVYRIQLFLILCNLRYVTSLLELEIVCFSIIRKQLGIYMCMTERNDFVVDQFVIMLKVLSASQ
jgi:hypothetical protein